MAALRDGAAVAQAVAVYRARVVPQVQRELRSWREAVAAIPGQAERETALVAIDEKGLNVEATAVFATLAPPRLLRERRGGGRPPRPDREAGANGIASLRHSRGHAAILAGVAGFYLSAAESETPYARPARERLLRSTGPTVRPIVALMRRRRR